MKVGKSYKTSQIDGDHDVIVIGSGIGGLSVAALLARAGKRVLVLEQHYVAGGVTQTFQRKGYEWDVGLHYMGEVHKPKSGLRKVFDDVTDGKLEWAPMPDVYNRIVIEDRTYEYVSGAARFKERMKEYFPREATAIDRYVDLVFEVNRAAVLFYSERAMPPAVGEGVYEAMSGAFRRFSDRTTLEVLAELTSDRELIAVLTGHFGDYGAPPAESAFAVHAMLIKHYIDGSNFPVGGSGRLAETIEKVIESAGGAIFTSARVERVLIRDGKAHGVRMADGREIPASIVISDAGVINTVTRLLPEEIASSSGLLEKLRRVRPSRSVICLNVGIRESSATLKLDGANLWVHPSNDFDGNFARHDADPDGQPMPVHFITFPSVKDPTWEDRFPGRTTVDVCSYTGFERFRKFAGTSWMQRGAEYEEFKARLSAEMWKEALRFAPQLAGKVDHMELATPLTFKHFAMRDVGDFAGLAHTPERFKQRWLRPHTPVEGLFLTGQDVTSDGVSGAMMGGVVSASAILGRNVMEDILARRASQGS
jgi:all-trans-retinol 13,14-reductase